MARPAANGYWQSKPHFFSYFAFLVEFDKQTSSLPGSRLLMIQFRLAWRCRNGAAHHFRRIASRGKLRKLPKSRFYRSKVLNRPREWLFGLRVTQISEMTAVVENLDVLGRKCWRTHCNPSPPEENVIRVFHQANFVVRPQCIRTAGEDRSRTEVRQVAQVHPFPRIIRAEEFLHIVRKTILQNVPVSGSRRHLSTLLRRTP